MQNMASGVAAEDSILVLQAYHIDVVEVQEFSCVLVRLHLVLVERPPHPGGIIVAFLSVVDRERQQSSRSVFCGNGAAQVRGERGDSTMSGKIISDHCDSARQRWLRMKSCRRCVHFVLDGPRTHNFQKRLG